MPKLKRQPAVPDYQLALDWEQVKPALGAQWQPFWEVWCKHSRGDAITTKPKNLKRKKLVVTPPPKVGVVFADWRLTAAKKLTVAT